MTTVFSGMQPSGDIHLGNYLAMVGPLSELKSNPNNRVLCSIVDLHAITIWQKPESLSENSLNLAAFLMANDLNNKNSLVFLQSAIKEHAELSWILSCTSKIGWLNRMIQFKEKTGKNKEKASCGLYFYPILMAADILLYNADLVPVGEDQKQHLEFTKDIVMSFNHVYKTNILKIPEGLILPGSRIMSLKDGTKKMSKSDSSNLSKILFSDNNDAIAKKIQKAKTDSLPIQNDLLAIKKRPEAYNLLNIYALINKLPLQDVLNKFDNKSFAILKKDLIESLIYLINPIRIRYNEILKDRSYLLETLKKNSEQLQSLAYNNLKKIKELVGFIL